jgi:cytochrome P450
MLAYPETQARAQAELDAVVGRSRLPTFADYPHLPYIRAMVKELLRWRPIAPLAAAHRTMEDDWYEGMFIPKGTICVPNVWHMNHDPEIFGKNAEHFEPGRYLDASGHIAPVISDLRKDGHFSYGFGNRICVGRHFADASLFINITTLLWAMKMERTKDASGRLVPLDVDSWIDVGLVVLAVFITYRFVDANASVFADVRPRLRSRSLHAFLRLLRCSHRNVNCGDYENDVAYMGERSWNSCIYSKRK